MGSGISCLDDDQYVLLDKPWGKKLKQGPGVKGYCCAVTHKYSKPSLTDTQYIVIQHLDVQGEDDKDIVEVVEGPQLYELQDPYAKVSKIMDKIKLTKDDYVVIIDEKTGDKKVEKGPALYTPGPYEICSKVKQKSKMSETQYIIVKNEETGEMRVKKGPRLYTPGPYERVSEVNEMIILNDTDYVYVIHEKEGTIDIVEGPVTFAPGAHDKVGKIQQKIVLKQDEYVKIVDENSGVVRVEKGPVTIVLKQYEKTVDKKRQAHEINEHTAVYIFNKDDGSYELITDHGMFVPTPTQEVVETRQKIRLEKHEVMVIVDKEGRYSFMTGSDETRSFFLPPYCHILEQEWSADIQKNHQDIIKMSRFDLRPTYMDFEFLIRTKDNVEIVLDLNFYWQILDVEKMVSTTNDAPEDICKHAMSQILSESSRKDMKEFMESFNEIVQGAIKKDDTFYLDRGVTIHKVEITGRSCKDSATEKIFHEIIKEKTNRIKNLEKKDGENEIRIRELEGQITAEKLNGELIGVKRSFMRNEAKADGESEADRIANFITNLPEDMSLEQKLAVYFDQQNTERVSKISNGNNQLYLTHDDVDIKITNMKFQGPDPTREAAQFVPVPIETD